MLYASICTGVPSTTIFWLDRSAVSAAPAAGAAIAVPRMIPDATSAAALFPFLLFMLCSSFAYVM